MISFIGTYLFALLLMTASFMLLARQYWIFELFVHFTPQFIILGLITVALLLTKRKIGKAVLLLAIIMYFGLPLVQLWYPPAVTRTTGGTQITLLEANVLQQNERYDALLKQVRELQPTIIVLNEVDRIWVEMVKAELGRKYVSFIELPTEDYRGMAVFSKLMIESYEVFQPSSESSPLIRFELKDLPLVVYVAHSLSPTNESWAMQRDVYNRQMSTMAAGEENDLLIIGDMNSTPSSPLFRDILRRGKLKLASSGFGLRTTWRHGTPIAIPIDHVLYRGDMIIRGFDVLGDINSDHRPILATIEIQE